MGYLQSIFSSNELPGWKELAQEKNGEYIHKAKWNIHGLRLRYLNWEVVFDAIYYEEGGDHTRIRVPFKNSCDLFFRVYRESLLDKIGKLFHMQDIVIGDDLFDKTFIIQGNQEAKVKELLASNQIKSTLQLDIDHFKRLKIEIRENSCDSLEENRFPEGIHQLYLECQGLIENKQNLLELYQLTTIILDQMVATGITEHSHLDFSLQI